MSTLRFAQRVVAVHDALTAAGIPFGFGGALALAYHVPEPRATNDIDVDVTLELTLESVRKLEQALSGMVTFTDDQVESMLRDGQARTYWDEFAVDIFFTVHYFHEDAMDKLLWVPFANRTIPIISAAHLAVLKALFNRPKDWVDIQEMAYLESFPRLRVMVWLRELLAEGADDVVDRIGALKHVRDPDPVASRLFKALPGRLDQT